MKPLCKIFKIFKCWFWEMKNLFVLWNLLTFHFFKIMKRKRTEIKTSHLKTKRENRNPTLMKSSFLEDDSKGSFVLAFTFRRSSVFSKIWTTTSRKIWDRWEKCKSIWTQILSFDLLDFLFLGVGKDVSFKVQLRLY